MGVVTKLFCFLIRQFLSFWYLSFPAALLILYKLYNRWSLGVFKKDTRMTGKTVVITGANSGLGEVTALDLAARGARVIMACRDLGKANGVRESIVAKTNNSQVVVKRLDLGSLASVREFAAEILQEEKHIHVLINNAGAGGLLNKRTRDGLQLGMQVNHFAPFLLTNLLLGKIRDSAPSRIINVSSVAHRFHKIDLHDLQCEQNFDSWTVYANAKLCNILMTTYLTKLLEGTGVTANSVHPGIVMTHAWDKLEKATPMLYAIVIALVRIFHKTAEEGAQTQIYAAVDPDLETVSGKYFQDCRESRCIAAEATNLTIAELLWNQSAELVNLTKSERNY